MNNDLTDLASEALSGDNAAFRVLQDRMLEGGDETFEPLDERAVWFERVRLFERVWDLAGGGLYDPIDGCRMSPSRLREKTGINRVRVGDAESVFRSNMPNDESVLITLYSNGSRSGSRHNNTTGSHLSVDLGKKEQILRMRLRHVRLRHGQSLSVLSDGRNRVDFSFKANGTVVDLSNDIVLTDPNEYEEARDSLDRFVEEFVVLAEETMQNFEKGLGVSLNYYPYESKQFTLPWRDLQ